jgi:hypothetical protein
LDFSDAVGHAIAHRMISDRQQIFIAMAAGDTQQRTAHEHVRAGHLAGVDGIAQVHVDKAARAHVAHAGDAGHERGARIHHAVDGVLGIGLNELAIRIEVRIVGEMCVHIDEAGQNRHETEIDDGIVGLRLN